MQVTVPVLFCLIMFVGVVGNVAVIVVIVGRQQGMSGTVLNQLLLNLAASDSLFLVLCIPFVTYHYSADNWAIGEPACRMHQYILYVCVYVTVYTLVSIAAARFMTIVHSDIAARLLTRRAVSVYLVALWIVLGTANLPVNQIYVVKSYGQEEPYYYCAIESDHYGRYLFTSFSIFAYIVPLTITGALYVAIAHQLRLQMGEGGGGAGRRGRRHDDEAAVNDAKRRRPQPPHSLPLVCKNGAGAPMHLKNGHGQGQVQSNNGSFQQQQSQQSKIVLVTSTSDNVDSATSTNIATAGGLAGRATWRTRSQKRNQHAIRLLVTVVVIFALCWLPMHIHLLLVYFVGYKYNSRPYEVMRVLSHCLAYSNCCMNPIIYNYTSPDFRRSFRELFRLDRLPCLHPRRPTDATQLSTFERHTTIGGGC